MKLSELLSDIEILEWGCDPDTEIGGISYDSRSTQRSDLFVAIRGFVSDGHDYIESALERGAVAVLCEDAPEGAAPYVCTGDTRLALALASKHLFGDPAKSMKLIGVTGTNGKTTVTTLIKHVIESVTGAKVGLVGTNQNMIGLRALHAERTTPESYELYKLLREMSDEGCAYAVMEVSSHSLALSRVAGLEFEVGVFTNLTQDHLDFHADMREYAETKARLFRQCKHGAVNLDDEYAALMIEQAECEIMTFSTSKNEADLIAKDIKLGERDVRFCALSTGVLERVQVNIPGKFTVYNTLAVIACAQLIGISMAQAAEALGTAAGVKGRVETVPTDGDYAIVIDYAHTPDALENVLSSMREAVSGRIVVVFGCGGDRDRGKRPKMGAIAAELADFVIVTSDNPRTEEPAAIIADILAGVEGGKAPYVAIENRIEAIHYAIDSQRPGDLIILAGKGHEDYQEINGVKHHMDEREIVAEYLAKRDIRRDESKEIR